MAEWGFSDWLRAGLIWAAIFAVGGGIIAQTSEGASGRGFVEGMWKGLEWFAIIVVSGCVLVGAYYGVLAVAGSMNH
jgi:hypothetical protein